MRITHALEKAMELKLYHCSKMQPLTSVEKSALIPSKLHQFILPVMSKNFLNILELNSPILHAALLVPFKQQFREEFLKILVKLLKIPLLSYQ